MNPRLNRWIPALVASAGAAAALATLAMTRWVDASGAGAEDAKGFPAGLRKYDPLQRLELITYDWRARRAADRQGSVATNLGLVLLDDATIVELRTGRTLGTPVGPLWPRFVYGLVLRELRDQGAQGVAVDILLGDERPDHGTVPIEGYTNVSSDTFFAREAAASGNVILASLTNFPPAPPFRKSMMGDVDLPHDVDGTARRVNAFADHVLMHPSIEAHARRQRLWILGVTNDAVLLQSPESETVIRWPINADGSVRILRPNGALSAESVYVTNRVWHMGIALASLRLGLDLANARIEPGRILFPDTNGVISRILPVTPANQFFINWTTTTTNQARIKVDGLNHLVLQALEREANPTNAAPADWAGTLVVIGSTATGNNMADRGATPIAPVDFLVSTYVNVTDSLLRQQFVHFPPAWVDYLIVLIAALLGSALTWRLKTVAASLTLTAIGVAWIWIAFRAFEYDRLWLPMAHPLLAGLALNHAAMLTYRSIFEQNERQRVRGIFSKIVSPNVVQELLKADRVSLGGARRELTVFFADVRGFTELTDRAQEAAEEHVRKTGLTGTEAEAYFEQQSTEVLQTVNLYLATIADVIKRHRGTLDKYIGDCVMAFWGAPTPNPRHAVDGVCAAVDAQQSMERLNVQRDEENVRREAENVQRASQGLPPLPPLARLALGTGINSGFMTVGLMGSDSHILNYTVFGREVNLAARLEGVSGRGRIIIGETTYKCLVDQLPKLAARCIALEPVSPKGFRQPVPIYEVPWRDLGPEEIPELKPNSNPPTTI